MINSLKMKNWKSHEDTQIHFGKGSNLFIGKMGSGKTSAIDAISFALFGTFPALKSRKVKLEELVMARPKKHSAAEIELDFELSGKKYKIVRHAGAKTTSAQLFADGKLVEAQTSRVTEMVESILQLDYDLFSRIIYAEQNRIDYLLSLPKGDRKKQVDELLGISKYEEARANVGMAMNKAGAGKRELERYLDGAGASDLRSSQKSAIEKISDLNGQKAHLQLSQTEMMEAAKKARKRASDFEQAQKEQNRLQAELSAVAALISDKQLELKQVTDEAAAADPDSLRSFLSKLELSIKSEQEKYEAAVRGSSESAGRIANLKSELARLERESTERAAIVERKNKYESLDNLKARGISLEGEIDDLNSKIALCRAENAGLASAISALHTADAKCPVCDSDLSSERKASLASQKHAHKHSLDIRISELGAKLLEKKKAHVSNLSDLEELRILEFKLEKWPNLESELKRIKTDLAAETAAEAGQKALKEKHFALLAELKHDADQKRAMLLRYERVPLLKRTILELQSKEHDLRSRVSSMRFSPEELSKAREELISAEKDTAALSAEIDGLAKLISAENSTLKDIEKKLAGISEAEREIASISSRIAALSNFQDAISETQLSMRTELIEAMNEAMGTLWPSVYPYGDYRQVRIRITDDDYQLEFGTQEGEWVPIDNCSGGEKSCAALAMRVAFAMVLTPNLSWLILDEPTHNLDAQAVVLLNRALHDEIPKIVEQTFIITHDEALKEGASSKVFYFERDKDNSERTIVEETTSNSG